MDIADILTKQYEILQSLIDMPASEWITDTVNIDQYLEDFLMEFPHGVNKDDMTAGEWIDIAEQVVSDREWCSLASEVDRRSNCAIDVEALVMVMLQSMREEFENDPNTKIGDIKW